ncbi:unnamed protein product [Dicrocoelium dendriticum]|nr:unnamed protein product [Dicrocoelium dendriticum]
MTAHIIMMFLWIISLVTSSASSEFRLSDSKLLLPYNSYSPLNYTLRGSDGTCYEWSSGTPEVATVSPLTSPLENCSTEAVVTAVWPSSIRTITTIYARVLETGHVVECDVIVDNIRRIEVETTTQELYLHNTPESLVVVGYDEYGNTFSSLHGVPFKWSLHEDSQVDMSHGHSVLRFLSWSESEYATPPSIQNLESRGLQGHMQLVSGLRTGSALVSASLHEPVYSNVPAARVRLLVMANARLSPALAYLIPSSRLKLQVRVLQQGGDKVIHLPSPQYHLHVNDTTLVDLDEDDGCTITAKQYGQTEIKLLDRNVEEALANQSTLVHPDESTEELSRPPHRRFPVSIIHVVEPAYLRFSLQASDEHSDRCLKAVSSITRAHSESAQNHHKWVLEFGRKYTIHIDLYDHNNHRLYPSDDIRLNVTVSGERLQLIKSTINFTWFVVQPVAVGIASIEARTIGLADKSGSLIGTTYVVTGMQEATIYSPIDIQPSFILLPWSIGTELNSSFQLVATGGNGVYTWLVLDPEGLRKQTKPVVITPNGEVSALTPGDASIVASSTSNPQLCGFAKVSVTFPASIKFVPGPAEVVIFPVGSHDRTIRPLVVTGINRSVLTVGLAVLDSHGHSMSDCRGLNITIKPLDISVVKILPGHLFVQSESSHSDLSACLQVHVVGITVGFTELEAVYHLHSLVPGMSVEETDAKVTLSARFPVAVHQAIDFLNPSSSVAYAALGSTRTFLVNHGPQPWPVNPSGHFARIKPVDPPHPVGPLVPLIKRVPQPLNTYVDAYGVVYDDSNLPTTPRLLVFSIQCQSVGAFRFYLEIGNEPSPTNMLPLVMDKEFT